VRTCGDGAINTTYKNGKFFMKKKALLQFFLEFLCPESKEAARQYLISEGIDPDEAKRRFRALIRSGKNGKAVNRDE